MKRSTAEQRRSLERLDAEQLSTLQLEKLNQLLAAVLPINRFYRSKLASVRLPLTSLDELSDWPFTFKDEISAGGQEPGLAANLTYPVADYSRFHRTSGTRGHPLSILDTTEDWDWWIDTWQFALDAAEVNERDRVMMAFSFGPFIGFWSAFDAVQIRKALVIPGGGLSSLARLDLIRNQRVTVLFCTPTYALHLVEVARDNDIDLGSLEVRRIVVAGEPGGSLPSVRERIESAWQSQVVDHGGATEVGPWGYADCRHMGLHIVESEFIAEFLSVETGEGAGEDELSELVLTTLGRHGSPVIRYRTGDLVRPSWNRKDENRFVFLEGGVLGRADDMMIIRGVNVFPSSVEQVLRSFPEVVEFRMTADRSGEMDTLAIEVEDRLNRPERISKEIQVRIGLRVDVEAVPLGSLPRSEAKGQRFVDRRG